MRNPGELLFEEYLTARGYTFDYEPPLGTKRPDYLVRCSPAVLCEVEELVEAREDRPAAEAAARGESWFGSISTTPRVREKLNAGAKQLSEFKGRYPCVIVLRNTSALMVELETLFVQAAMYGDAKIEVPIDFDDGQPVREARLVHDRRTAKMRASQNTTVSAVAVLEYCTPNQHLVTEHIQMLKEANAAYETWTPRTIIRAVTDFMDAHPETQDRALRLRVIHNRHALMPLPTSVFDGPHDEHIDSPTGQPT